MGWLFGGMGHRFTVRPWVPNSRGRAKAVGLVRFERNAYARWTARRWPRLGAILPTALSPAAAARVAKGVGQQQR